ncbi:amidase [Streptomyces dioscori]|uniref:Amidase n=1 Tax=Streptomyces dioscori TaxID=2109333 RepID=A0A2P8Q9J9_9ACTN|nr:amidase family protein [Streptomyces dioscori]PSM42927.1 amidase [Streptomyces dioscori]
MTRNEPGRERISTEETVRTALDRADAAEGLNAFIALDIEGALEEAVRHDARRGWDERWCLAVKDNIHVANLPNTAGTPALAHFVPGRDAPVVAALRSAGAIVVGKTNMHELALGGTSHNHTFGAVGNATDPALFAGGSSGGTAAAVAAGIVDAGLGTDTGGSVTIPAALNGVYGLRPSSGRYPADAMTPLSVTRDTPGPITRTLERLTAMDTMITGETGDVIESGRRLRLGLPRQIFAEDLDDEVRAAWENALGRLAVASIEWVPVDTAPLVEFDKRIGVPLVLGEFSAAFSRYLDAYGTGLTTEDVLEAVADRGIADMLTATLPTGPGHIGPSALASALRDRRDMQTAYASLFGTERLDALVSPTVPVCARPLSRYEDSLPLNGRVVPTFFTLIRNTSPAATAGLPSVTLPLPVTTSPPVGLQLVGSHLSDRRLLATAARLDDLLG